MSSVTVCNCAQKTPDLARLQAIVPDGRTSNRKSPTAVHAEPVDQWDYAHSLHSASNHDTITADCDNKSANSHTDPL